jgi:excinuclease ABC subunit C
VITDEEFPRVIKTRDRQLKNAEYFGPYPSVRMVYSLLDIFKKLFFFRTCNLKLNEKDIQKGKFKACVAYQMHRCKAPCIGLQTRDEYLQMVQRARQILRGKIKPVLLELEREMKEYAERWDFEKAHEIKEKWLALHAYQAKSIVSFPGLGNLDVFSLIREGEYAYANFLRVVEGNVILGQSMELKSKLEETDEELLLIAMGHFWSMVDAPQQEVLVPFAIEADLEGITFIVPKRGDKKALLDLSFKNAESFKEEQQKKRQLVNPEAYVEDLLARVQTELGMNEKPYHIECFDNSNFQGKEPVASCVVFKMAKPAKSEYRIFNIKTVEGPNDFASMKEVVYRRYKRQLEEGKELPQLVIIDGGKGQLHAAYEAISLLGLQDKIFLIGIAKRLEEIFRVNDPIPLYLNKKGDVLKFIQKIRDEAHRFAIKHHRNRRNREVFKSKLMDIPGLGEKTLIKLYEIFDSIDQMLASDLATFQQHFGEKKGKTLYEKIHAHLKTQA